MSDKRGKAKIIHIQPDIFTTLSVEAAKKDKPLKLYIEELITKHALKIKKPN